MPLAMARVGEERTITRLAGKDESRRFLEKLGFVVGASVSVVAEMNGNLIVNIKGARVAISREMANKVFV